MAANTEHIFNNLAYTRLKKEVTAIATTFYLYDGGAAPFLPGWVAGKEMYLTLTDASSNIEIIKVTAISADILTVERGQDSSTAQTWHAGAIITQRLVAASLDQFIQKTGFRSIDYNPNGVLAAAYDGEKVYQTGGAACNTRWWRHTTGTKWRLIAGDICAWEGYDGDGYLVSYSFGEDWTSRTVPVGANIVRDVAYNGSGLWVAVGDPKKALYSADTETWSLSNGMSANPTDYIYSVCYDEICGWFVAVCYQQYVWTSTDGITWTNRYGVGQGATDNFKSIAYHDGLLVAVGRYTNPGMQGDIKTSDDGGITWTRRTPDDTNMFNGVCWAEGLSLWVAINSTTIETSTDGITWTDRATLSRTGRAVAYGSTTLVSDILIAVCDEGWIYRSVDGITWTKIRGTPGAATDHLYGVKFGEGPYGTQLFCAVGANGKIETSSYGLVWETETPDDSYSDTFNGIGFGDNQLIAVGTPEIQVSLG